MTGRCLFIIQKNTISYWSRAQHNKAQAWAQATRVRTLNQSHRSDQCLSARCMHKE